MTNQIKFNFKADKHGNIKSPKLSKVQVFTRLINKFYKLQTANSVKRTASRLWLYKKSKFKDAIEFDLNACRLKI